MTYTTLNAAEAAMHAVSPAASLLQFERIVSNTGSLSVRLYSIPDVEPNPATWSDWCNVPGEYASGQEVCDARRALINWGHPLTFIETNPSGSAGNGEGGRGLCQDLERWDQAILGYPQRWRSCPIGYSPKTYSEWTYCGGKAGGPDMTCGNPLTATITVRNTCPIPDLSPLPDDECTNSLEDGAGKDIRNACPPMTEEMQWQAECLAAKIGALGIPYGAPTATIRSAAYQSHLQEVWDKWSQVLQLASPEEKAACSTLRSKLKSEIDKHALIYRPGDNAPHVAGRAVDIPRVTVRQMMFLTATSPNFVDLPAHSDPYGLTDYVRSQTWNPPGCQLRWGGTFRRPDIVHFQLP